MDESYSSKNKNRETNKKQHKIFSFKLNSATTFKQSIAVLCDSEFNPEGVGFLKVSDVKDIQICVRNTQTQVIGGLRLQASWLYNFHCNKPYMINLNQMSQVLTHANDSDTITIFHLDGSTKISFIFSSAPATKYHVDLLQKEDKFEFEEFPCYKYFCTAKLTTEILRQMIQLLEETERHQLVSVKKTEELVIIKIGKISYYDDDDEEEEEETVEDRNMTTWQKHYTWLQVQLHHLEFLKKASFLAPHFKIRLLSEPLVNILLVFNLDELGQLVFHERMKPTSPYELY